MKAIPFQWQLNPHVLNGLLLSEFVFVGVRSFWEPLTVQADVEP
jgi:hypothetical protein